MYMDVVEGKPIKELSLIGLIVSTFHTWIGW